MKAAAFLLAVAAAAAPLSAGPARQGTCLTFLVQSADYRGDLAVPRVLWHFEKAFSIPKTEPAYVLGVSLGFKAAKGSWEVAYLRSSPGGTFADALPASPVFHVLELNGRSFVLRRSAFHPYFLGGIGLPILRIPHGAAYQGRTYDAIYVGGGVNLGAGLAVDLGPRIVVSAGVMGRLAWFLYAYGGGKGRDINHLTEGYNGPRFGRLLRSTGLSLTVGLGFIL